MFVCWWVVVVVVSRILLVYWFGSLFIWLFSGCWFVCVLFVVWFAVWFGLLWRCVWLIDVDGLGGCGFVVDGLPLLVI